MSSKKESISAKLTEILQSIQKGTVVSGYTYQNTVSYVDRQYYSFTENDVLEHPMPWILINCDSEDFKPLPSGRYDNNINYTIIGFVKATEDSPDLDTVMNNLQRDILTAILTNKNLSGLATQVVVRSITTVSEMIYPHGAFVIEIEVNYSFIGVNL